MVDPDLAVRPALWLAVTGDEPGVAAAGCGGGCGLPQRGAARGLIEAFDDRRDLGAVDADIGERAVIERHQFVMGALPLPPSHDRGTRRNKEIDKRHGSNSYQYGALQ